MGARGLVEPISTKLECGAQLGRYELLTRIGLGGMASVWVARCQLPGERTKRLVAVKAMLPELLANPEFRGMFLEEGRLIQAIHHPHVVRVFEVGEQGQTLFMSMEWLEGDSLHALIAEANKRRPIPTEVAVRVIADTASGLHSAHEVRDDAGEIRGIVHCDVSPHNILVGVDGTVKLVDFGVASAMNQIQDSSSHVRGKFAYMSPEQTRGDPLDRRSDIFSLGIVLFELTTGYRLFKAESPQKAIELVRSAPIPPPTTLRTDYPPALEKIVLKALEREPDDRFDTAEELQLALEHYLVGERILVPTAGVSSLLKRVLGERLNDRRTTIRGAVLALSDGEETEFVPADEHLSADRETDEDTGGAFTAPPPAFGALDSGVPGWWLGVGALAIALGLWFFLGRKPELPAAAVPSSAQSGPANSTEPAPSATPPVVSPKKLMAGFELDALPAAEDEEEVEAETLSKAVARSLGAARSHTVDNSLSDDRKTLGRAASATAICSKIRGPSGTSRVRLSVTSSGKVVGVSVGAPFAGSAVGRCIESKFRRLKLSPGTARTFTRSVRIRR